MNVSESIVNVMHNPGGSIHHFHKSDMKFLSDSTSERIMRAVNAHPNNTNINMRFLMPGPWSDEYYDYNYQWQSWNREERSTILMIKKTNPFKVARKKTERCPYNTRDERYEKGNE